MQPIIGITGTRHVIPVNASGPDLLGLVSSDDYSHGVEAAGGLPLLIPYLETEAAVMAVADRIDGLLLAGGEDVDPQRFDQPPALGLGSVVPERDELECTLIRAMLAQDKPIFGICRGIQVLNVALGGTLYQDMAREWRGRLQHRQKARRNHLSHSVSIAEGSQLRELLGGEAEVRCNSFHHQAVRDIAPGLRAVAWDEEGLVEGVEHESRKFVVAVQWHPENLWRTAPQHHGLFKGLVKAASE